MLTAALAPFYTTATAVLMALLVTWLLAEAKSRSEARAVSAKDGDERSSGEDVLLLTIGVVLLAATVVALRVQYRESASELETDCIWIGVGVGFGGVVYSLGRLLIVKWTFHASGTAKLARICLRLLPIVAAVGVGYVIAPHRQRLVGVEFRVYGTCLSHNCGLRQRLGPGSDYAEAKGARRYEDGDVIRVVCQTSGSPPPGRTSRVWDRLPDGHYVSDAFVLTPASGELSSLLPRC